MKQNSHLLIKTKVSANVMLPLVRSQPERRCLLGAVDFKSALGRHRDTCFSRIFLSPMMGIVKSVIRAVERMQVHPEFWRCVASATLQSRRPRVLVASVIATAGTAVTGKAIQEFERYVSTTPAGIRPSPLPTNDLATFHPTGIQIIEFIEFLVCHCHGMTSMLIVPSVCSAFRTYVAGCL